MRLPPTPLLLAALLGLCQCKKKDPDPVSQLPPATQTGANTFGCLVNGQPWLPSGNNGGPNSVALYDPGINTPSGAQLNIATYRISDSRTYIRLACGPIVAQKRTFVMTLPMTEANGCYEGLDGSYCGGSALTYLKGQMVLTRIDEQIGIISGTFWFTSVRRGSPDTLKVTQGRFDYKF